MTRPGIDCVPVALASSRLRVDLDLDQRRKGLLWYDTYGVTFSGALDGAEPGRRAAPPRRGVEVPVHPGHLRRVPLRGERRALRSRPRPVPGRTRLRGPAAERRAPPSRSPTPRVGSGSGPTPSARAASPRSRTSRSRCTPTSRRSTFRPARCRRRRGRRCPAGGRSAGRFARLVTGQRIGMDLPNRIEPRAAGRPPHLVRPGVAAVLPGGDGHPRRAAGAVAAPDALRLRLRRRSSRSTCCSRTSSITSTSTRRSRSPRP